MFISISNTLSGKKQLRWFTLKCRGAAPQVSAHFSNRHDEWFTFYISCLFNAYANRNIKTTAWIIF